MTTKVWWLLLIIVVLVGFALWVAWQMATAAYAGRWEEGTFWGVLLLVLSTSSGDAR